MAEPRVPRLGLLFFAAERRGSAGPSYLFGGKIYSVCPIDVLDLGMIIRVELVWHLLRQLAVNQREL